MEPRNDADRFEVEIDLVRLLFTFLHRWQIFALCALIATSVAIVFSLFYLTPMYKASITLYVNNSTKDRDSIDYVSSGDVSTSRNLVSTYITISKSERVMGEVSKALDGNISVPYLMSVVSAEQENKTELFRVTVTTADPERSALIANTIADVFPDVLAGIVEGSSAKVIDYAKVPKSKSSPNNTRNAMIGFLIGVVVAATIVTVEYLADVRIKEEDDLKMVCDYPTLGYIPDFNVIARGSVSGKGYGYGYGYGYGGSEAKDKKKDGSSSE